MTKKPPNVHLVMPPTVKLVTDGVTNVTSVSMTEKWTEPFVSVNSDSMTTTDNVISVDTHVPLVPTNGPVPTVTTSDTQLTKDAHVH
jgi:hypothetical protein